MAGLFYLFAIFFYIGLFSVGGALSGMALVQQEVLRRGWFSLEEFFHMVAISEATPGPIGVNLATFIGYQQYGIVGAVLTTLGNILPGFILILLVAAFFKNFRHNPVVEAAFSALRAAVLGLIGATVYHVLRISLSKADWQTGSSLLNLINWPAVLIFAVIFFLYQKFKLHPVFYIILGGVAGLLIL